ncbi:MAG: DUF1178 family protein [Tabrizicola sp.]|jgi:hypothetical protein|nr:DUF1178 family protein [Tabrizicola sp.]
MIRFSLKCSAGHGFDSWFQRAEAFAALQSSGQLACPICGDTGIEKSLMAPAVRPSRIAAADPAPSPASDTPSLREPQSQLEAALAELRRQIEANSEYVGMNFAVEARKMHQGEAPARAIHGEARPEDARAMIEDGLPVAPLPFLPARKVN